MANSLFTSLLGMLDKRTTSGIAGALGEPEQSISRGLESSIAAVLGGLASKSQDPDTLSRIMELAPNVSESAAWPHIAGGLPDMNSSSPLISGGKRVLAALFGTSESDVTSAVSAQCGLRPGVTSTLLAMAAPMVMSFLGKRVRGEGMTVSSLGNLLQRESGLIRSALPTSLNDLFWPRTSSVGTGSPVVAQTIEKEKSSSSWLAAIPIAALLFGLFWLFTHAHRPVAQIRQMAEGTASRVATDLGTFVKRTLPNNVELNVPEQGVETRLLAFIQNPAAMPDRTTWFDFDRLVFDTGSATLRPESQEQISNITAILMAYPKVHIKIGGYTDNVGDAEQNLQLSQQRANAVMRELVRKGVSPDRLEAEGYGEQYPIADNSTEEGRAKNRRVSMRVTEK